eukprot:3078504-Alexandrium_andersonii.AAC.1
MFARLWQMHVHSAQSASFGDQWLAGSGPAAPGGPFGGTRGGHGGRGSSRRLALHLLRPAICAGLRATSF